MGDKTQIEAEDLAYWYFRLNGFLTIKNFVVHGESEKPRTEVDILGVRFPCRAELLYNPMPDDTVFTQIIDRPYIIIAEVTTARCKLNGPWTKPKKQNMERILRAIGAFADADTNEVAKELYKKGLYEDKNKSYYLSLFCVGKEKNSHWLKKFPKVPQKLWDDILKFIYNRFKDYHEQKVAHKQWDITGNQLWNISGDCATVSEFAKKIEIVDKITVDDSIGIIQTR